ncbi:MAG: WecB/TagA/CpsF family glycosyltransferase [Leptonema sp. (in: Bacteria)]|nr:WecB/TagA/CpsF family glycosyltransferase [Leptonema sp. (in: bacteria)]
MSRTYSSAWEDRDYLLEYKSIDLNSLTRVELLDVPIDVVTRDEAVAKVFDMLEVQNGPYFVQFLDPLKLVRMRRGKKLAGLADSHLMLADGAGIEWASKRLHLPFKGRVSKIAFLMDLFRLAHKKEYTIYLLGSTPEFIERVFQNLTRSMPGLRIIGRQSGHFNSEREQLIKESMRKSAPDLILIGMGFPYQEIWMRENKEYLSKAVVVGIDGAIDVLSGKKKKAPDSWQLKDLTWFWRILVRPYRLDKVWYTIKFFTIVLWRSFKLWIHRKSAS